jgi:DNA processing protein
LYADLVEEAGSALAVLDQEPPQQISLLGGADDEPLATATADIAAWGARGIQPLTVLDADYPDNLRGVHDRPPLIFVAGRLASRDARSVAVVGTRRPTPGGIERATAISEHLVATGYTVVSGLAAGIDTAAHRAALAKPGGSARTIAVIGTGLGQSYPPQNAGLQQEIARTAAVVSQFWPDAPPSRRSFPMRNAVMSGLTLATVVVEATYTSGARIQARLAHAHGRPVLLTDMLVETQAWAREFATRPGTYVVSDPAEVTAIVERLTSAGQLVA